ncbi:unnamed protein product [Arctia plantaginis]|uniref:FP protein C-terminal domain-containing protein n=1 Tax=Arctia plantaginis TaxID=874455 RepID=A0A8S0ZM41_ARCPL|nr:unnamed protein product [Arctia plantaginis]
MFKCRRCEVEARDGATCSACMGQFDFPCAGLTEVGWRKLGDRKATWKCGNCKSLSTANPRTGSIKVSSGDLENIAAELKRLSAQMEVLPALIDNIKAIQTELMELRAIRTEFSDMKASIEFVHEAMESLTCKVSILEQDIISVKKTKDDVNTLQHRVEKLENLHHESEQRSRMNNIEIKGVPMTNSENLFTIVAKIGDIIKCPIPKDKINYVARVPMRNDKLNKNIICSVHNNYLKSDFVSAAKKHKNLKISDLGLQGDNTIYINDHLTLQNKMLLNKTKTQAKDRGFEHIWIQGCNIFIRKNNTSPRLHIKNEQDLKKFLS